MLHLLDWFVASTGLVCCMYWTGVLHVLDWCVAKGIRILIEAMKQGSSSGGRGT